MSRRTVFLSYSHRQAELKDRLLTHLQAAGIDADVWDDSRIATGDHWREEIQKALKRADAAILLISVDFLTSRFILYEELPALLDKVRLFPVIAGACAWDRVPWLGRLQVWSNGEVIRARGRARDEALAALTRELCDVVKEIAPLQTGRVPEVVRTAKLPSTGAALFGREDDLTALDQAWDDPHCHILSIVADGGVGKSALVNAWLNRIAPEYRGAERVYGWSFYSQGARQDNQASADAFIDWLLRAFHDPNPAQGSPWDKGERLAQAVARHRTLLVLDGLEPLQEPPGGESGGRLRDPAIRSLLRTLARRNPGLCIVTTRVAVPDLQDFARTAGRTIDLTHLSPQAGADYLRSLGVRGRRDELEHASRDFDGHALALTLLGTYLVEVYGGDLRRRDLIPSLVAKDSHAGRMLGSYEEWFEGKPELAVLRAMGFFDGPTARAAFRTLGLDLDRDDYRDALATLSSRRLLDQEGDDLDCHPLIRDHFARRLRESSPAEWKEGNRKLYEYYKGLPAKKFPDTLGEMEPLYAAVIHGCRAGLHQETLDEVFQGRIGRGNEAFSTKKLGAFNSDLAVLAGFFDRPWSTPVPGLREADQAFVLGEAGFLLRGVGRLTEAAAPLEASLNAAVSGCNWKNATIAASNLSELCLTLGNIARAVEFAERSVELADRSGDVWQRSFRRTTVAAALHHAGRLPEAEALFSEAEDIEGSRLYSLRGFQYCNLLLDQGKPAEVLDRATAALAIAERNGWLLDQGLDHLSLGRAHLIQNDLIKAATQLNQAVNWFRRAGVQDHVPRGLLARATLRRLQPDFDAARTDLDEAYEIATRSGMRLYEADCYLEYARLALAQNLRDQARTHFTTAKDMVAEMGYHRRDPEVAELERRLA